MIAMMVLLDLVAEGAVGTRVLLEATVSVVADAIGALMLSAGMKFNVCIFDVHVGTAPTLATVKTVVFRLYATISWKPENHRYITGAGVMLFG